MANKKYYDYEKGKYIQTTEEEKQFNLESVKKSSINPSASCIRTDETIKNKRSKLKLDLKKRFIAGILSGVILTSGAITAFNASKNAINDYSLATNFLDYASQFKYAYYTKDGKVIYQDEQTANYILNQEDFDIDTLIYFIYKSYHYYPQKHIEEVLKYLRIYDNENKLGLDDITSLVQYIDTLGYESVEQYSKEYKDIALDDIKKRAQINQNNPEFPVSYDFENDSYKVNRQEISKGGR